MVTQGGAVTWTINKFYVVEPAGADTPAEIIPLSAPFDVRLILMGLEALGRRWRMQMLLLRSNSMQRALALLQKNSTLVLRQEI